jgi:hypothetical protein
VRLGFDESTDRQGRLRPDRLPVSMPSR